MKTPKNCAEKEKGQEELMFLLPFCTCVFDETLA
jgi:hypothetical protein